MNEIIKAVQSIFMDAIRVYVSKHGYLGRDIMGAWKHHKSRSWHHR
jgi:hypothetical protein